MTLDELIKIREYIECRELSLDKFIELRNATLWIINREIKLKTMNVTGKDD